LNIKNITEENLKTAFAEQVHATNHLRTLAGEKIEFLIFEEKKNRQLLEELFSQKFPDQKVTLPKK